MNKNNLCFSLDGFLFGVVNDVQTRQIAFSGGFGVLLGLLGSLLVLVGLLQLFSLDSCYPSKLVHCKKKRSE
jgi:hypothetical protein